MLLFHQSFGGQSHRGLPSGDQRREEGNVRVLILLAPSLGDCLRPAVITKTLLVILAT